MNHLAKVIRGLSTVSRWGATVTIFLMMVLIAFTVVSRGVFNAPIVGDYELVQLMMVIMVGLGFSHAEAVDAHVKVGLLVDRFNKKAQAVVDILGYTVVVVICFIIGTIQFEAALEALSSFMVTTSILGVPHYPFQFLLGFGFFMWGLEALLKVIYKSIELFSGKVNQETRGDINVS